MPLVRSRHFPPSWRWAAWAAGLALAQAGCGGDTGGGDAPVRPPPVPITLEELRSAEYPADLLDRPMVRLTEGAYPPPDSSPDWVATFELTDAVAVDSAGPEVALAAAVTRESGGGTGMFYWLHLLERRDSLPRVVASTFLGDRIEPISLRFAGDTIVVRMVTQGPTDAFCCPTLEVVKRFVRDGTGLLEVGSSKQ